MLLFFIIRAVLAHTHFTVTSGSVIQAGSGGRDATRMYHFETQRPISF